jgi:homocysteine S-methyltransferase
MSTNHSSLPQLEAGPFLTDAGCETDIIFNRGVEIREFAAHTLLEDDHGREVLAEYYRGFLSLAADVGAGMVLDAPTWKAHPHWAADLGVEPGALAQANQDAVAFSRSLRQEYRGADHPIVVNGLVGPRGDAYSPDRRVAADEAQRYHVTQIGWLAEAGTDLVTALTFTSSDEAVGAVRAAGEVGIPVVVSFTVETDGRLPSGESLRDAIDAVDRETDGATAYFMVNCAHPDHVVDVIDDSPAFRRVRGLRCNASRLSHAELDEAEVLDDGDPEEFAEGYATLADRLPSLTVYGGCCGSDLRHVTAVAARLVG